MAFVGAILAPHADAQFGGPGRGSRGSRGDMNRDAQGQPGASRENGPEAYYMTAEELRIDLKLTPEQQPAWDSFMRKLDAMRGDVMRERARVRRPTDVAAPQQIDRTVDSVRNRLTALEDAALEAKTLYAKLSDEQKKTADARLARLMQIP